MIDWIWLNFGIYYYSTPGPNNPFDKWPPAVYDHFLSMDPFPMLFNLYLVPVSRPQSDKLDLKTVIFAQTKQIHNQAVSGHTSVTQVIVIFQMTIYGHFSVLSLSGTGTHLMHMHQKYSGCAFQDSRSLPYCM